MKPYHHNYTGRERAYVRMFIQSKKIQEIAEVIGVTDGALRRMIYQWRQRGYKIPHGKSKKVGTVIERDHGTYIKQKDGKWLRVKQGRKRYDKPKEKKVVVKKEIKKEPPKKEPKQMPTKVQDYSQGHWVRIDKKTLVFKRTA